MKIAYSIFLLLLTVNLYGQQLDKAELIDTEWFCENTKNHFTFDSIKVELNDTIYIEKRVFPGVNRDSIVYGQQELQSLGHGEYAVFWFMQKNSLGYWVIFDSFYSLAIVGKTPSWNWTFNESNKTFTFIYPNRPNIEFSLVSRNEKSIIIGKETMMTEVIGLERIK